MCQSSQKEHVLSHRVLGWFLAVNCSMREFWVFLSMLALGSTNMNGTERLTWHYSTRESRMVFSPQSIYLDLLTRTKAP